MAIPLIPGAISRGGRLGLRDLRGVRGGLPGPHRARRQDRRDPAQPRPRGEPLPGRADARLPGHGVRPEPVGPAAGAPASTGRRGCRSRCRLPPTSPRAGELDRLEVLYWVGCAAAFDERNRRVARAFATCLHAAGVRFAVLGQEEACTGDPARRMGNEYVFQLLAAQNVETLRRYGPPRIVTACPHCFNTIANEYPQLGGTFEVIHHSAFLARLLGEGRLATLVGPDGRGGPAGHLPRRLLPRPIQRRRSPPRGTCWAPFQGSSSPRWTATAGSPSAAAREAGGCGWRRAAGPGSTPSGRARRSRPAPRPWRSAAPSA